MKKFFLFFLLFSSIVFGQIKTVDGGIAMPGRVEGIGGPQDSLSIRSTTSTKRVINLAKISQYKIYNTQRDTTIQDTSLTIQKDYKYNLYRKDRFGYQSFANIGQYQNILDFGLVDNAFLPNMGFESKHHNYIAIDDISYFEVATPLTELYFKTVQEQGQSIDSWLTFNTNKRTNFFLAYKAIRSLGNYVNNLTSHGNFRFSSNYSNQKQTYFLKLHIAAQDFTNGENGGLVNVNDFFVPNPDFSDRARIPVWLNDAESLLQTNRYFLSHVYKLRPNKKETNIEIRHELMHENKFYQFTQNNLRVNVDNQSIIRFGETSLIGNLDDKTSFNQTVNKASVVLTNNNYGQLHLMTDFTQNNYFYNRVMSIDEQIIPNRIQDNIQTVGARYLFDRNQFNFDLSFQNGINVPELNQIKAKIFYKPNEKYAIAFDGKFQRTLPDLQYRLFQSSYVNYIWFNDFSLPTVTHAKFDLINPWVNVEAQIKLLTNHLYFKDISENPLVQTVSPHQADIDIQWFSIRAQKEFKFRRWAWDNTALFQQVAQQQNIVNVPEVVVRSTLYYSNHMFKKAMYYQTGIGVNYFSEYYANEYNPVLGQFFVQDHTKVGNYPMIDLFFNARILQTRIFFKAEHINALWTKNPNYMVTPTQPYRDFLIRFGLVWNFFQ